MKRHVIHLTQLGVTYWSFSDTSTGYFQEVRRLHACYVPNAILTDENYERFRSEYHIEYIPHPDIKRFRIDVNIECVDTKVTASREYLVPGWGDTPEDAEADVIKRIQAPGLYAPCPACRATRSDIDFVAWQNVIRCRICGHERPAQ